jgi:hypothetical protein
MAPVGVRAGTSLPYAHVEGALGKHIYTPIHHWPEGLTMCQPSLMDGDVWLLASSRTTRRRIFASDASFIVVVRRRCSDRGYCGGG